MFPGECAFDFFEVKTGLWHIFVRVFCLFSVNYFYLVLHIEYLLFLSVGNWQYIISTVRAMFCLVTAIYIWTLLDIVAVPCSQ